MIRPTSPGPTSLLYALLAIATATPAWGQVEGGQAAPRARGGPLAPVATGVVGGLGRVVPIPFPAATGGARGSTPGEPAPRSRPRPGGIFDPGAAGPGISQSGDQNFLDGALDPRTGWPFVFLDHFRPRPDRVEPLWIVSTRDCPQEFGTDPWPKLKVRRFDGKGDLVEVSPGDLLAALADRPALLQVQGNLTTPDSALGGLLWTHAWLASHRCLPPDALVIAFDWPSERVYRSDVLDTNEKGRRAFVASWHLAEFVRRFPPSSRACLLGQSYGGRVVLGAMHLLGGGALNSGHRDPLRGLAATRPDLGLNGVLIAGASDRDSLDPGHRLGRALAAGPILNLYNRRDESLIFYPLLWRSDHRRALGRVGLTSRDLERLGPLAARYEEQDIDSMLGTEHSLLDATANPRIGRWIAPYAFAPDPGPLPPQQATPPNPGDRGSSVARRAAEARLAR